MKKYSLVKSLILSVGFMLSSIALGADGTDSMAWGKLAAAFAISLGAFGAATGQGRAASAALEGLARNPSSRAEVFVPLILSLVFMELQALLCFVVAMFVL